jgi:hypothetical protein
MDGDTMKTRLEKITNNQVTIPLFIFRDRKVAGLECMTEYLHDVKKVSFHEIAILFNRDDRTVWTAYTRAKNKRKK